MINNYLELLTTLNYLLNEKENSWWYKNVEESIKKYNKNKDINFFLETFSGRGFSDEPLQSRITDIIMSLTYDIAFKIKKNEEYNFIELLFKKYDLYNSKLTYLQNLPPHFGQIESIKRTKESLAYIKYLIGNYKECNLLEITQNYLIPNNVKKR